MIKKDINNARVKLIFLIDNPPPKAINCPEPPKQASKIKNQKKHLNKVNLFSDEYKLKEFNS
jgi:hypothetical protein